MINLQNFFNDMSAEEFNLDVCEVMTTQSDMYCGINIKGSDFFFRLGYLLWIIKGANSLSMLQYYGDCMDECTDDGKTLRGAYGARLRHWVGPDALQEAIDKNQDVNNAEPWKFVKPLGIDQLEAIYEDLKTDIPNANMQIFDPALDFEETNHVPDLINVQMVKRSNDTLNMILNFGVGDFGGSLYNDVWVFTVVHHIMSSLLGLLPGDITIVIGKVCGNQDEIVKCIQNENYKQWHHVVEMDADELPIVTPELFWDEFKMIGDLDKHMRSQIQEDVFTNADVAIVMLVEKLVEKFVNPITISFLKDIGLSMLIGSLIMYADNLYKYRELFIGMFAKIESDTLKVELYNYIVYKNEDNVFDEIIKMVEEHITN